MSELDLSNEVPAESLAVPFQVSAPFNPEEREKALDLTQETPVKSATTTVQVSEPFNPEQRREEARGDLARGLLWLLTFAIGGVLAFVGLGRLDGTVITQSIFPSLVALAGTALGFYFGSQSTRNADGATGALGSTPQWPSPSAGSKPSQAEASTGGRDT